MWIVPVKYRVYFNKKIYVKEFIMKYLGILLVIAIAFYTFIFGLEIRQRKNQIGFLGVAVLAITVVILPLCVLFFR